jgi:uncharacterized integral membrane protein (TIGR00697 family)
MIYLNDKAARLFIIMGGFFLANVFIAEFIGVKIFSLEETIGLSRSSFSLFGKEGLSFDLTAGVLLWPFVFVLTDIINEYYGEKGVRMLSFLSMALIVYAFGMFYTGMQLQPASWWIGSKATEGITDMNKAFGAVFGQGLWIVVGSLFAFLIGQLVDVTVFHQIKKRTGESAIWLRATGSTLVSQFIDSYVVLFIAFYVGAGWDWRLVLAIGTVNYIYKFLMALLMTPAIYLTHIIVEQYLGKELAASMKKAAAAE